MTESKTTNGVWTDWQYGEIASPITSHRVMGWIRSYVQAGRITMQEWIR